MVSLLTIARNTFIESTRQPIFLVMMLLGGFFQYLNTAISAYSMGYSNVAGEVTRDDKVLFDVGLATVFVLGILLAAFIATSAVSKEIENRTILTVVSKPVPRASVVIGKFLGVAAAMAVAIFVLTLALLFAIQHGVLLAVSDPFDGPVLLFGVGGVALSLGLAAAMNFLYGWSFPQTASLTLAPVAAVAYAITLFLGPDFALRSPLEDFKPEVIKACVGVGLALLVMTAVATAASTRLGQVMTIVACAGVLLMGLLTNHFLGREAFVGEPYASVERVEPDTPREEALLDEPGHAVRLVLEQPPEIELAVGDPVYFAPSPNGVGAVTPAFAPPDRELDFSRSRFAPEVAPALAISRVTENDEGDPVVILKMIGGRPLELARMPEPGDWLFAEPPTVSVPALAAWSVVPNLHNFWLVDAVTQGSPIPLSHLAMIGGYAVSQIAAALAVAVLLFGGRDVG